MGNSIINWIDQWLTDRRQRVVVDEEGKTGKISKFEDHNKLYRKTKEVGDKHKHYKITLIHLSGGLTNGRCYSLLGSVNVDPQGLETLA